MYRDLLLDQLGVNFLGPAPLDLELLHMLTTFHWNALGSTLGWWFWHNNTVSCNEKFWVEQVTVPHPPLGKDKGWGRTRGGGGYLQWVFYAGLHRVTQADGQNVQRMGQRSLTQQMPARPIPWLVQPALDDLLPCSMVREFCCSTGWGPGRTLALRCGFLFVAGLGSRGWVEFPRTNSQCGVVTGRTIDHRMCSACVTMLAEATAPTLHSETHAVPLMPLIREIIQDPTQSPVASFAATIGVPVQFGGSCSSFAHPVSLQHHCPRPSTSPFAQGGEGGGLRLQGHKMKGV